MRRITLLIALASYSQIFAEEKPASELERVRSEAVEARKAAAADPTIKDAQSAPVRAYLAEQKRRRLGSIANLRERIEQAQGDKSKESLVPIWKEQLVELEKKPLEPVNYDSSYGYQPETGLVGYSKKVRLLLNTSDGKSVIQVENIALLMEGLGTSQYSSGKFLGVDKAILIGPQGPDQTIQGAQRKTYTATLVDLESVLKARSRNAP